jgi:glycosyltransferase involved in cell wall biosynthesis
MFDDAKPSWVKRNFVVQAIKNLITNQIDALWLPSEEYDKEYETLYSKKNIRYLYGYDCIDNDSFNFLNQRSLNNKKIVCVSRLVPKKNIRGLLNAWQFVEANDDSYRLVILGDGPEGPELKKQTETLALKRVDFVGAVPNEQIPKYLFEADAFVSPSHYESWGLVVNEAMAAGLPVLLSDKINAAFTLLENGRNGYLFNAYSEQELQQALLNFISLPVAEKMDMSKRSLELISKMDFNYMGKQLLDTLQFLSKKPHKYPGFLPSIAISRWSGRYNTLEWDKVKTVT